MAYFFIKATLIMKKASTDFNLGFNYVTFRLNLIVIVFEVSSAICWSCGLLVSARYTDEKKILKANKTQ